MVFDLDEGKKGLDDAAAVAEDVGDAGTDATDPDQSAADKARNVEHDVTDAMRDAGLGPAANAVDDFFDNALGQGPPPSLPPIHCRLYVGKQSAMERLKSQAIGEGMDLVDSAVGAIPEAGEMLDGLGAGVKQGIERELSGGRAEKDLKGQSRWKVLRFTMDEALDTPFRLELTLVAWQMRPPLPQNMPANKDGSFIDDVTSVVQGAQEAIEDAADLQNDVQGTLERLGTDPMGALGHVVDELTPRDPVDFALPTANVPIDPAKFLNLACSVSLTRDYEDTATRAADEERWRYPYVKRWVSGIVTELEDLGTVFSGGGNPAPRAVRIVIRPSFWKLSLRKDCRIFENKNALQIVHDVFRSAGVYGFLPDLPGVAAATDFLSDAVGQIPIPGEITSPFSDMLSGENIKTFPPAGKTVATWTMKREYCVQYDETDMAFVTRLLEEEGITFWFDSERGLERFVLMDDPSQGKKTPTVDGRVVPFSWPLDLASPPYETLFKLTQRTRLTPTKVSLRDYNFSSRTKGPTLFEALAKPQKTQSPDVREVYEYPARAIYQLEEPERLHYRDYGAAPPSGDDADAAAPGADDRDLAKLRLEAFLAQNQTGTVQSNLVGVMPGRVVKLKAHRFAQNTPPERIPSSETRKPSNDEGLGTQTLVVTSVRHNGFVQALGVPPQLPATFDLGMYNNQFEYRWVDPKDPDRARYRPPRVTGKPTMRGVQTATVVDDSRTAPEDVVQQIHMDHHTLGRIKVRFHWDQRGEAPLSAPGQSCWLRVVSPWAGNEYGCVFTPRVGMEVVVGFLDDDPDRPVVLGCVYNGLNPVPVEENRTNHSTIRTRTNPTDVAGHNELRFDDAVKKEVVYLRAQRYLLEEVRAKHETTVGKEQYNTVLGCHGEIVDGRQELTVHGSRKKTVLDEEDTYVDGTRHETVTGTESITITRARDERVKGREKLTIGSAAAASKEARRTLTVEGTRETVIGDEDDPSAEPADDTLLVELDKTDTITGPLEVRAGSLSTGQPGATGSADNAGGMDVGQNAGGDGTMTFDSKEKSDEAKSGGGVELHATGKVAVRSEQASLTLAAASRTELDKGHVLRVSCNENTLQLESLVTLPARSLAFESKSGSIVIQAAGVTTTLGEEGIEIAVEGDTPADLTVGQPGVSLMGGSLVVVMADAIDMSAAVINQR